MKVCVNGLETSDLSVLDRGLAYGDGLFETMRVKDGKVPLLQHHLARLKNDSARLCLPAPDCSKLECEINTFCADQAEGVLKLIYTRGEGGQAYRLPESQCPTHCLILRDSTAVSADIAEQGIALCTFKTRLSRNQQLAGIKHLNKLEYVLAAHELKNTVYREGLLFDTEGYLIEALTMNIFIQKGGVLYTPDLTYAGVAGVMRHCILDAAEAFGIKCCVDNIAASFLENADAVFLSNSVQGVVPVNSIADQSFDISDVTRKFQEFSRDILLYNN